MVRAAERAARAYIASKLRKQEVKDIEITVEAITDENLSFDVEVNLDAIGDRETCHRLVEGAVEAAHATIEKELGKLAGR